MDRKIYNYKSAVLGHVALRTMFTAIALCFILPFNSSLTPNNPWPAICMATVPTIFLLYSIVQVSALLRESITIENGQLTYIDKHSRKISCALTDVIGIETLDSDLRDGSRRSVRLQQEMYRAVTTAGNIWFYPSIDNFADLQKKLADGAARHAAMHPNQSSEGVSISRAGLTSEPAR